MVTVSEIEQVLSSGSSDFSLFEISGNAEEQFQASSANRLLLAYQEYLKDSNAVQDLMLCLRDFMLLNDTSLNLPDLCLPEENDFGIFKGENPGEYLCALELPDHKDNDLIEQVYSPKLQKAVRKTNHNLQMDEWLQNLTGFSSYKTFSQKMAVFSALTMPDSFTALITLPTGGGKSLVTQSLGFQKEGLTVVIVPTVSLAIDQKKSAQKNIKAIREGRIDSDIVQCYYSQMDSQNILEGLEHRSLRLLFLSPESFLENKAISNAIERAAQQQYLKNIIIDEVHLVTDWGSTFRPDYQALDPFRRKLLEMNPNIRTYLLSATVEEYTASILRQLFSRDGKWIEFRFDALRQEPRFVLKTQKFPNFAGYGKKRSVSLKGKKPLTELICKLPHPMIVYVSIPQEAEELLKVLQEKGLKRTACFTGNTSSKDREQLINLWKNNEINIMIATSAFGVGVDKNDVRTVLHACVPENPNSYYQELGRGGRDGLPCLSYMNVSPEKDLDITEKRIKQSYLTKEKFASRWTNLLDHADYRYSDDSYVINTSVAPNYDDSDENEEISMYGMKFHRKWNILVLLLLQRKNMIAIDEVFLANQDYKFTVRIMDDRLWNGNEEILEELAETIRKEEIDRSTYQLSLLSEALLDDECWSEMFFETYPLADQTYCGGCRAHHIPDPGYKSTGTKVFKKKIDYHQKAKPVLLNEFLNAREILVFCPDDEADDLISRLLERGVTVVTASNDKFQTQISYSRKTYLKLSFLDAYTLVRENPTYYFSAPMAAWYSADSDLFNKEYERVRSMLALDPELKVIHIVPKEQFVEFAHKNISEIISGPQISKERILMI